MRPNDSMALPHFLTLLEDAGQAAGNRMPPQELAGLVISLCRLLEEMTPSQPGRRLHSDTETAICRFLQLPHLRRSQTWFERVEALYPVLLDVLEKYGSGAAFQPLVSWADRTRHLRMELAAEYDACYLALQERNHKERSGSTLVRPAAAPQDHTLLRPAGNDPGDQQGRRLVRPSKRP